MKKHAWFAMLIQLVTGSGELFAGDRSTYRDHAQVLGVEPVVERVSETVSKSVCDEKGVNDFPIASSIADDIRQHIARFKGRCRMIETVAYKERISSYRVTYRYGGYTAVKNLSYHPGHSLPVNVSLLPLY
ncbi:MAG: hypothetical protein GY703_15680 [Gammaproteobacteria bacterium]|nr:hypothetical protein [Gammaproteobacteria bacterium]